MHTGLCSCQQLIPIHPKRQILQKRLRWFNYQQNSRYRLATYSWIAPIMNLAINCFSWWDFSLRLFWQSFGISHNRLLNSLTLPRSFRQVITLSNSYLEQQQQQLQPLQPASISWLISRWSWIFVVLRKLRGMAQWLFYILVILLVTELIMSKPRRKHKAQTKTSFLASSILHPPPDWWCNASSPMQVCQD